MREFRQWQTYAAIQPFGEQHEDWRAAMLACTIVNVMRSKGPPFKVSDFMPTPGGAATRPRQTVAEQLAIFKAFSAQHNARIAAQGGE